MKTKFKQRRAGYTMFVQEYYTFRSWTSSHCFNLVDVSKISVSRSLVQYLV